MNREILTMREQCSILSNQFILDLDRDEELERKDFRIKKLQENNKELTIQLAKSDALLLECNAVCEWRPVLKLEMEKVKMNASATVQKISDEFQSELNKMRKNFNVRLGNIEQSFAKLKEKHGLLIKERDLLAEKVKLLQDNRIDSEELTQTRELLQKVVRENEDMQKKLESAHGNEAELSTEIKSLRRYVPHSILLFTELCNVSNPDYKMSVDAVRRICETGPMLAADARKMAAKNPELYPQFEVALENAEKAFVKSKWVGDNFTVDVAQEYAKAGIETVASSKYHDDHEKFVILSLQLLQIITECKNNKASSISDKIFHTVAHMIPVLFQEAEKICDKNEVYVGVYLACRVTLDTSVWKKYQHVSFFEKLCEANAKSVLDKMLLQDKRF